METNASGLLNRTVRVPAVRGWALFSHSRPTVTVGLYHTLYLLYPIPTLPYTLCPGRAQGAKLHAAEQDESLGKPHSHNHPAHGRTDMRMRLRDGHTSQAPQMRRHCCGDCTGQDTHVHIKVRMTRLPCWCALHGAAQQHFILKIRLCRPLQSCVPSLRVRNAAVELDFGLKFVPKKPAFVFIWEPNMTVFGSSK